MDERLSVLEYEETLKKMILWTPHKKMLWEVFRTIEQQQALMNHKSELISLYKATEIENQKIVNGLSDTSINLYKTLQEKDAEIERLKHLYNADVKHFMEVSEIKSTEIERLKVKETSEEKVTELKAKIADSMWEVERLKEELRSKKEWGCELAENILELEDEIERLKEVLADIRHLKYTISLDEYPEKVEELTSKSLR